MNPAIPTKTGLMVGLGESTDELLEVFRDLAAPKSRHPDDRPVPAPSSDHLPVARLYPPEEFRLS